MPLPFVWVVGPIGEEQMNCNEMEQLKLCCDGADDDGEMGVS